MGDIKLNTTSITNLKLGDTQVSSVYLGNTLVWSHVTYVYLLDLGVMVPYYAYSLRKLKSTYSGYCLKVRRTTTNTNLTTQVDVAFDSNNTISLDSLIYNQTGQFTNAATLGQFAASIISGYTNPDASYCDSNQSIYVTTWYDQTTTTTINATNASAASQPRLVLSGVLETSGGVVSIRFTSADTTRLTCSPIGLNINNVDYYTVGSSFLSTVQFGGPYGTVRFYLGVSFSYNTTNTFVNMYDQYNTPFIYEVIASTEVKVYQNGNSIPAATGGVVFGFNSVATAGRIAYNGGVGSVSYGEVCIQEVVALAHSTSTAVSRQDIETNMGVYYNIWDNNFSGLLDTYPNAFHAHSLRKLRKLYTGPCLRVRRTDPTSLLSVSVDVYFDSNNTISLNSPIKVIVATPDTAAINLGEFAASTYGVGYSNPDGVDINQSIYVVTWYDQSDARNQSPSLKNATQATTTKQPILVSGGTLQTLEGKVAIRFVKGGATTAQYLAVGDNTGFLNNLSSYFVGAFTGSTAQNVGYGLAANTTSNYRFYFPYCNGTNIYYAYSNSSTAILDSTYTTSRKIWSLISPSTFNSAVTQAWTNGSSRGTYAIQSAAAVTSSITIGGVTSINTFDGYIQEIVCWPTSTTITSDAIRQAIELAIKTYWEVVY